MGGSGGRSSSSSAIDLRELQELRRSAQQTTDENAYNAEVEDLLQDALSEFNDRDVDAIRQHLEVIEDALSKEIEGSVSLIFGGSVAKHTYVNGLSDIDMLGSSND